MSELINWCGVYNLHNRYMCKRSRGLKRHPVVQKGSNVSRRLSKGAQDIYFKMALGYILLVIEIIVQYVKN